MKAITQRITCAVEQPWLSVIAAAAMFALVLTGAGQALAQEVEGAPADQEAAANAVVATVNGVEITESDLAIAAVDLAGLLQQVPPQQQRNWLISFLIDLKVISAQASNDGLADTELFRRQMAFQRERALAEAKLSAVGDEAISPEAIQASYDESIKDFQSETEVRARHILVESEETAKELRAKIEDGASFEEVASEHSIDGTRQNGGNLGYFTRGMTVKPFGDAAFAMEVGDVSDPVQSQFGWHIIKVEDKRETSPPTLDERRVEIIQQLSLQARRDYVLGLREGAEIARADAEAASEDEAGADGDAPAEDAKPKTE